MSNLPVLNRGSTVSKPPPPSYLPSDSGWASRAPSRRLHLLLNLFLFCALYVLCLPVITGLGFHRLSLATRTRLLNMLSWNVHGLNDPAKCSNIKLSLLTLSPFVICLQESKLVVLDVFKSSSFLPATHSMHTVMAPSIGASGGLVIVWDRRLLECTEVRRSTRTITTFMAFRASGLRFTLINVYGPCSSGPERGTFLQELEAEATRVCTDDDLLCVVLGDFNVIRRPEERSNDHFNAASASLFNDMIRRVGLQDLPLWDRRFTWSNRQQIPILAKLDCFLISNS